MSILDEERREGDRIYEEFEPPSDWDRNQGSDTLILMLPGFKKEQLRVQVTSTRVLRVSGERQISENKWRRFRKEFPMLSDSDTSGIITAKFEAGILYIKLPKVINKHPQIQEIPKPQQPITTTTTTQKTNNYYSQVSDQKKEEKSEVEEPKKVPHEPKTNEKEESKEKPKKEKGKEKLIDDDIVEGSKSEGKDGKMHKRSSTMEMLSIQKKEYLNAVSSLVDEVKKQKKLVNLLFIIFFGLLFGLYVKNAIKSYF